MFGPGTLGFAKWVGADRRRRPHSRVRRRAPSTPRCRAGPGPVVLALPEDMLTTPTAAPVAAARRAGAAPGRRPGALRDLRELLADAERPFVIVGGSGWTRAGVRRRCSASPRAGSCRSAAPSASRTCSTTAIRTTPATSASASIRSSRRACSEADLILAIGPRLGEMTTGGYTLLRGAAAAAEAGPHPRRRRGARPRLPGRPADQRRRWRAPRRRWRRSTRRPTLPLGRRGPRRRTPTTRPTCVPTPVAPLDMAEVVRDCSQHLPADTIFTNGAGNFAGWLHRFYRYHGLRHAAARSSRRPRARWATACRPASPRRCSSRSARRQHRRRRRLPDERPGARDRDRAVRRASKLIIIVVDNGMLRHDPHAPGARVPGRGSRHRLVQPRLRRAGAGLRLVRGRARRDDGGVRAGAARRARRRPAGADPSAARRRRDHQPDDARARSAATPRPRLGKTTEALMSTTMPADSPPAISATRTRARSARPSSSCRRSFASYGGAGGVRRHGRDGQVLRGQLARQGRARRAGRRPRPGRRRRRVAAPGAGRRQRRRGGGEEWLGRSRRRRRGARRRRARGDAGRHPRARARAAADREAQPGRARRRGADPGRLGASGRSPGRRCRRHRRPRRRSPATGRGRRAAP